MPQASSTSVVERNRVWRGQFETEPWEAAWATEAIFFIRSLDAQRVPTGASAQIQLSPDGMHWCDEGTCIPLPTEAKQVTFGRVGHFGGWLRLVGEVPPEAELKVIAYLALK